MAESVKGEKGQPPPFARLLATIRGILGGVYRWAMAALDRLAHSRRHRRARELVKSAGPVSQVLVLCHGNICRSPYAAAVLEQASQNNGLGLHLTQGGFFGPDRPANDTALHVARDRGIELGSHRSRLADRADATVADLIITMEPKQADRVAHEFGIARNRLLVLGDLDPESIRSRSIRDPYGRPRAEFVEVFDRIDRCVAVLSTLISSRMP